MNFNSEFVKSEILPDPSSGIEARPNGAPLERATSNPLDPRRDGHVWPDLGAPMPGADIEGRGFGGGAPKCTVAEGGEHLSLTLNRLIETTSPARCPHCGKFSVLHIKEGRFIRIYCKTWGCSWCGPRKAKRLKHAIRVTAEIYKLSRLVSLTLNPKYCTREDSVVYLNQTFAKLRTYLKREFKVSIRYIRILEFQSNGMAHLHLLVDRYIPHFWLQKAWQAVGGGRQVNVKYVDIHRVSPYLAKYLTKELLMSAPKRSRRVTVSRGIQLIEKPVKDPNWRFIRKSIESLLIEYRAFIDDMEFDEGGLLRGFVIFAPQQAEAIALNPTLWG